MSGKKQIIGTEKNLRLEVESTIFNNTSQSIIQTTQDKLELCLRKYLEKMDKSRQWVAPLGVFLALLIAVLTASFKDALYLKGYQWDLLFKLGIVASGFWFLITLRFAWKPPKLEDVINDIKNNTQKTSKKKGKMRIFLNSLKKLITINRIQSLYKYLLEEN